MSHRRLGIARNVWLVALLFCCGCGEMSVTGKENTNKQREERIARLTDSRAIAGPVQRRALLVGCKDYQEDSIADLPGTANDVVRMREVLMTKYDFASDDIVVLSDEHAQQNSAYRPTRANIVRELKSLAEATYTQGAQVVVLLSGHGGRQRDSDPPGEDEVDGYDEVFCPVDVGTVQRSGEVGSNGITDDEIGGWLRQMSGRGANVWLIADACHTGTLTRGIPDRPLTEDISRGIGDVGERPRGPSSAGEVSERHEVAGGRIVAFYAAPPTRKTYDTKFNGVPHGLFTYWICHVLENSDRGRLTYRKLIERVYTKYEETNRTSPVPQIEGEQKDTVVLGTKKLAGSDIRLSVEGNRFTINAGTLRDAHVDSVLAVYPADDRGDTEQPLGFVCVTRAEPMKAWVQACRWEFEGKKYEKAATLSHGDFCRIVHHSYEGLRPLAIHLIGHTGSGDPLPPRMREVWERRVRSLESDQHVPNGKNPLLRVVDHVASADWLIQVASHDRSETAYLLPAEQYRQPSRGESLQVSPANRDVGQWLRTTLNDIARSRNLLEVAAAYTQSSTAEPKVEVELRRLRDADDFVGFEKINVNHDTTLTEGDLIGVRVKNRSPHAVFATLLFIDGHHQMHAVFPTKPNDTEHRLEAGGKQGDSKMVHRFMVNADTVGLERFVVITVKDQPDPPDFTFLATRTLTRSKGSMASLQKMLAWSVHRPEGLRGQTALVSKQQLDDYSIQVVPWRTVAKNADTTSRGTLFGYFRKGPATDLKAEVVKEHGSVYHTADRTKAVLGAYGELLPGNKLLGRPKGFEQHSIVRGIGRVGGKVTVKYAGKVSGDEVTSVMGDASWQQFAAHGLVDRSSRDAVTFHVAGVRLNTPHVIHLLNRDRDALRHFRYLESEGREACVVLENIVFPVLKHSSNGRFGISTRASSAYPPAEVEVEANRHQRTFFEHRSALVRCYQMHRVRMQRGQVVALERVEP